METFGCSTAACESTFSALTAINRPQRLAMHHKRMANLVSLAFENERTGNINIDKVLLSFNAKKDRRPPESDENYDVNKPKLNDPFWDSRIPGENDLRNFGSFFDIRVHADPFEMHQFFEQKMNEMFRSLTSLDGFSGFNGSTIFDSDTPAIEEKRNPRDYYLKPGFNKPNPNGQEDNTTEDSWLNKLMPMEPEMPSQPRAFSSFRSVVRRSVTLPDGTVKTEEIIRNSDGTEQRTESHSLPDGSNPSPFDAPFTNPDFSGLFNRFNEPQMRNTIPKNQFLKPGYEKLNPYSEKIDKDLDKEILRSGTKNLPSFSKDSEVIDSDQNKSTMRTIMRKTITLPNGEVESEEVVRNSDGMEQRTVTKTLPDGTTLSSDKNNESHTEEFKSLTPSFALRGLTDLIDMLFK